MNSSYQHVPGVQDPENSERVDGTLAHLPAMQKRCIVLRILKKIQNNFEEKRPSLAHSPLNPPLLLLNVTAPLGKLLLKFSSHSTACWSTNPFSVAFHTTLYLGKCCLLTGHPMSCFTSPGLSDSTFVAPCQWCAKLVTDYSVEKICE